MERDVFERHFDLATTRARELAKECLVEALPDSMVFHLRLNASYDAGAQKHVRRFPQDTQRGRKLHKRRMQPREVTAELWREGYVPEWIDVRVVGETGDATVVEVTACGRFNNTERLYYSWTDVPPFGVKGPFLPVDWAEGQRFSIYERAECWGLEDLSRARANAPVVWSLTLHGRAFHDDALRSLSFPRLQILELRDTAVRGSGLAGLAGLPNLRHLRLHSESPAPLDVGALPVLPNLESCSLRGPERLVNVRKLPEALPRMKELLLSSTRTLEIDDDLRDLPIEGLGVECPRVPKLSVLPRSLRALTLHCQRATDDDVRALLERCPATLEGLNLRGTSVSDAIIDDLERLPHLTFLDVVGTRVSEAALRGFVARRGSLRCFPRLDDLTRGEPA